MKTLILYYSLSGSTKRLAQKLAEKENCDAVEIKERKKRNGFTAFFGGCPAAMSHKTSDIIPLDIDFSMYGKFILLAPIWAGHPAPPMNNMLEMIPGGKDVDVILVSGGGASGSSAEYIQKILHQKNAGAVSIKDIKTADIA
jgi:hypothetical protein